MGRLHLLGLVEGDIGEPNDPQLFSSDSGAIEPIPLGFYSALKRHSFCLQVVCPEVLLESTKKNLMEYSHQLPASQRDRLLAREFDLTVLINSNGGRSFVAERMEDVILGAQGGGGNVSTFAFNRAESAGAFIWELGDFRWARRDTHFLWHTGELSRGIGGEYQEEIQRIRGFWDRARELYKRRAFDIISRDEQGRGEISCDGDILKQAQLGEVTENTADLIAKVHERAGNAIPRDPLHPINRFLAKRSFDGEVTRVLRRVRGVFSTNGDWSV